MTDCSQSGRFALNAIAGFAGLVGISALFASHILEFWILAFNYMVRFFE
jgi:hypothetical protein